jgi:predicted GNAT superfamily acetyltransferase
MKVFTTKGVLDFSELDVTDTVELNDTARVIATEWRLKGTDEIVRRDVNANILVGHLVGGEQGEI